MEVTLKKWSIVAGIVLILASAWLIHRRLSARQAEARREQAQRDAAYQRQLATYQHDLQLGSSRATVIQYLSSRNVVYSQLPWDVDVQLGREPGDGFVCSYWTVYVELKFSHLTGQAEASPFDNLSSISIQKRGECL